MGHVVELERSPAQRVPDPLPVLRGLLLLRFSLDPGPRRSAFSAAYALLGVGLIPLSIAAVHIAQSLIHPTVFTSNGPQMDATMFTTFLVSWAAVIAIGASLYMVELRGKRVDARLRRQRLERAGQRPL